MCRLPSQGRIDSRLNRQDGLVLIELLGIGALKTYDKAFLRHDS